MLIAYVDESGHSSTSPVVSIATFVASDDTWNNFGPEWSAALAKHAASYLHMREFAHRRGAFDGWSEERRRALLADLISIIIRHELVAVGAAIDVAGFNALPSAARAGLLDPFYCCMQEVVYGLAILGEAGDGCAAVFSRQDEFGPQARRLWTALSKRDGFAVGLRQITIQDMRTVPGLQAADLLAYELRHFYNRRRADQTVAPRWPFAQIVRDQTARGRRLLKYLPPWYLELQMTADFERSMHALVRDPVHGPTVVRELWPQLDPASGSLA